MRLPAPSVRPFLSGLRRDLLASALAVAAAVSILRLMGREWWCSCGDLQLWWGATISRHNSQHLLDPYTFTHLLHGAGLYALLWLLLRNQSSRGQRLAMAVALESGWEVIENTRFVIERYREATISLGYFGDSILNSLGDILACILGYLLAMFAPSGISITGFFCVEGILLYWIRDSLLLNLFMLIWPIEAVKKWQGGG